MPWREPNSLELYQYHSQLVLIYQEIVDPPVPWLAHHCEILRSLLKPSRTSTWKTISENLKHTLPVSWSCHIFMIIAICKSSFVIPYCKHQEQPSQRKCITIVYLILEPWNYNLKWSNYAQRLKHKRKKIVYHGTMLQTLILVPLYVTSICHNLYIILDNNKRFFFFFLFLI